MASRRAVAAPATIKKKKLRDQASVIVYGTIKQLSARAEFKGHVRTGYKCYRKWCGLNDDKANYDDKAIRRFASEGRSYFLPHIGNVQRWEAELPIHTSLNTMVYHDTPESRYAALVDLACRGFLNRQMDMADFQEGANPHSRFNKLIDDVLFAEFHKFNPTVKDFEDHGMRIIRSIVSQSRLTEVADAKKVVNKLIEELQIPDKFRRAYLQRRQPADPADAPADASDNRPSNNPTHPAHFKSGSTSGPPPMAPPVRPPGMPPMMPPPGLRHFRGQTAPTPLTRAHAAFRSPRLYRPAAWP